MNGTMTDFFTVWEIDDDGKKATVRMTSSRKVRDEEKTLIEHVAKNGYVNTSWSFVQFVGKAYNQLKKYEIKPGDKITKLNMRIQQEPYWDKENEQVGYPKNPRFTVFDFELPQANSGDLDKPPVVAEETEETEPAAADTNEYPF